MYWHKIHIRIFFCVQLIYMKIVIVDVKKWPGKTLAFAMKVPKCMGVYEFDL